MTSIKTHKLGIIIIIVGGLVLSSALVFLAWWNQWFFGGGADISKSLDIARSDISEAPLSAQKEQNGVVEPQDGSLPSDSNLPGWEGYAHPTLPFAFAHPKDLKPNAFEDGESEVVLLQGQDPNQEIQIIARPFDEPGPITVERIHRDIPKMVVDEPQTALVTDKKIPALLFWSSGGASLGKTRELWFVSDGYLYQVTARAEMDDVLAKMMETWRFE